MVSKKETKGIQRLVQDIPVSPGRVKAAQLASIWSVEDLTASAFTARKVVRAMVACGIPVLSDTRGYYRPASLTELSDGIRFLSGRRAGLDRRILELKMIAAQWEGQA